MEKLLGNWCKNNIVAEILEKVKRKTEINVEEFNKIDIGLVCLENGVLDLKNGKIKEHSPIYYFKKKLPLVYNKSKKCPEIEKFFSDVLYPEDIKLMYEWFGYNLYNVYFEKKAMILFGDPDTGKTITLNLLTNFIGEQNKIGLSLQKISGGKSFDLIYLKDKYSNIYDDLSVKDLKDGGGFKIATGGGYIQGEVKFGEAIDFKTFAKLIFACNKIPPIKEVDDKAYYNRWLPIPFDNIFEEKEKDKFLMEKLNTQDEMSGLLNLAIKGLNRLFDNNKFSFKKSRKEVEEIMQRSSHPLSAFSQDCLEEEIGNNINKQTMFEVYSNWCKKEGKARMTKEQIGRQLEKFVPYILAGHSGKERIWKNAVFKKSVIISKDIYTSNTKKNNMSNISKSNNNILLIKKNKVLEVSQNLFKKSHKIGLSDEEFEALKGDKND
ncbi:hypothetical protein ES702_01266 [subsurface metagenome]